MPPRQNRDDRAFSLDDRLAAEAKAVGHLALCQVLLRDERRFPWLVLVPQRGGITEPFEMTPGDETTMWQEVSAVARALKRETAAAKINVAAIGNMVSQCHIHVIARFRDDAVWPQSAIGLSPREPYAEEGGLPPFWDRLATRLAFSDRHRP